MTAAASVQKSPAWWGLAALCGLLLVLQLLLSTIFITGDSGAALQAYEDGQRLFLMTSGDEIKASQQVTAPLQAEEAPPQDQPDPAANIMADLIADDSDVPPVQEELPMSAHPEPEPIDTGSLVGESTETHDAIPQEPRTNASLAAVSSSLQEKTAEGTIPMREGEVTPFQTYRRPFELPPSGNPLVALLVSDLGPIKIQTEAALELPVDVTLAFTPYAAHTPTWLNTARNRGHESWLMLPAEPDDFPASDAGPEALLVEQEPQDTLARLHKVMTATKGYPGLVLPAGEAYSEHLKKLQWLNQELEARGLGLIAAEKPQNSAATGWFKRQTYTHGAEVLIDGTLNTQHIQAKLAELEKTAQTQGYAIGVIRPYPLSIKMAGDWLNELSSKGLVLAPVSAVIMK